MKRRETILGSSAPARVCIHGQLKRQCETCDLADRLEECEGRTCERCAHANHDDGPDDATTVCTLAASWFFGCVMPKVEGCTLWAGREVPVTFDIGDGPVE